MARKILLADDSVTAQNMGRKILADAGYDVVTVNNGSAALKRIAEINPDLIVLDVYMPGYSGLEVCQRLKDAPETAHLPVLLTVGKLEPFKAEEARRVRADGHIVKPFEASELLTAITRLEDSIVPLAEAGRLRNEGLSRKVEVDASADNGWKSRLGFSSKKKKDEKEAVPAGGSFRDFRKGKAKPGAGEAAKLTQAQPEQGQASEPARDIPRDITPEEMDVLSALAAKLNKSGAPSEHIAPPAEAIPLETSETVSAPAFEVAEAKSEASAFVVEAPREESLPPEVQTPLPASEPGVAEAEIPAFTVTGTSEIEIPVEHLEAATQGASWTADPQASEAGQLGAGEQQATEVAENLPAEMPAAVGTFVVETALPAQEPAPVDRDDEPMFASLAHTEQAAQTIEGQTEIAQPAEVSKVYESTGAFALVGATASPDSETSDEVAESQNSAGQSFAGQASNPEEFPANFAPSVPLAAEAATTEAPEGPAPTDEELTQALRLLTPSNGNTEPKPFSSHESLSATGQQLAEEVVRSAEADSSQGRSRWMAQPVAITPEEAAVSLEAEMFRAFAVGIQGRLAAGRSGEVEPLRITGVSAIATTVENRLAAAESAAISNPAPEAAITVPSDSADHASMDQASAATQAAVVAETEKATATFAEALTQQLTQDAIAREADVPNAVDATANFSANTNAEPTAAIAEVDTPDANSQIEADESMRRDKDKDAKSKSAKSKAQPVETVTVAAVSSDEAAMAEAPKAMAAAANGEVAASSSSPSASTTASSSSSSGPDAGTIASIVESVMADLRPKIVEEIVKKLAGK